MEHAPALHRGSPDAPTGAPIELRSLVAGGAVAFWLATVATSLFPVAAAFRAAASIAWLPMVTLESWIGGIGASLLVGYLLLHHGHAIPWSHPMAKAVVLAGLLLVVITILRALAPASTTAGGGPAIAIGALLDVPRFLVLGITIGFLAGRRTRAASTTRFVRRAAAKGWR